MAPKEKQKTILKQTKKTEESAVSHSKDFLKTGDKIKRSKVRTRSPLQNHRKNHQSKKASPSLTRSSAVSEQYPADKPRTQESKPPLTSDESSSGVCGDNLNVDQISPRKNKKFKENNRRKSIPRSPTNSRYRKRSDSVEEKPSSLPSTLARRRSSVQPITDNQSKSRLSPYR